MRLPRAAIRAIEASVDALYDHAKLRFLGPQSVNKRLYVAFRRDLSLPGLFESAHLSNRGMPDLETLDSLCRTAGNYLDASRLRSKARVIKEVQAFMRDAANAGEPVDVVTVLGGKLSDLWGSVTSDVRRIFDTEAQQTRGLGVIDGIARANAAQGIEDAVIYFVVVRDNSLCDECKRLHLLNDNITPRVYYLSEVQHAYHKKGEDTVCVGGLHPNCRCSMTTLMPGFGFDKGGMVTWKKEGHNELARQRGVEKSEHFLEDDLIKTDETPPEFVEVPPHVFESVISKHPNQGSLDSPRDYTGKRTFMAHDGSAGYALKGTELNHVFSFKPGAGAHAVKHAITQGAQHLTAFDGKLPKYYSQFGFREHSRDKNWTPGEPDVVSMHLHPPT